VLKQNQSSFSHLSAIHFRSRTGFRRQSSYAFGQQRRDLNKGKAIFFGHQWVKTSEKKKKMNKQEKRRLKDR